MAFIDAHHEDLGIEPICRELAIAPSSYHEHAARFADPGKRSARARRDDEIKQQIRRIHAASFGLYGTRKVWHQLRREGIKVAKCTVEQAIHARKPGPEDGLIHHRDRGSQYLAMNYTQRLAEAKLVPSVGSVGDSYDNALAETINGLYKAEVIWRQRSWPSAKAVEMATLNWVNWFNNHRLFGPIRHIPPAEAEANYYAAIDNLDMAA